ncbi:MAG TPA: DMT family transporter [Acidimicrobiales bacterium]|nr:DMT family transporter [Acidimicrobiales bacterium]
MDSSPPSDDTAGHLLGYTAVAAAAALWAVAAVVARRLFDSGVSPVELTESRAVLAFAGFALVPSAWRRVRSGWTAQVLGLAVAIALVNVTYYVAISRVPVAVALVIQYTAPALIVGWMAAVTRTVPSRQVVAALAVALVGVVLVVDLTPGAIGGIDAFGLAMAIASAVFFSTYIVLAEKTGAVYGSSGAMLRAFCVASLLWVVYQLPRGVPEDVLDLSNLPGVLYVGLAGTLAPFLLFAWGVGRVRAERAAIAATLEPVIAAVVAWGWLGQHLSALQVAGAALVVGAVVTLQLRRQRPLVAPDV